MMHQHMLGNMRDRLLAVSEIQQELSLGAFDKAAGIAEKRLGMSSLTAHGASHMAPHMPKEMQEIGTQMHRAASQFAVLAEESPGGHPNSSTCGHPKFPHLSTCSRG
jgi:hypothetical protein